MKDTNSRSDHVTSLERGLKVMETLAHHSSGLTMTEVAKEAGMTRAGARRFLLTLVAAGYAVQTGRRFALSARLLSLARDFVSHTPLWVFAEPYMREVSEELSESCSAAVLDGREIVYVARIPGRRIMTVSLGIGTRLPAHCTALGRALLSGFSEEELRRRLEEWPLTQETPNTVTDKEALIRVIRQVGEQGYAFVNQELEMGLMSLAVPVKDRSDNVVAAINVSTHTSRFTPEEAVETILPKLSEAAGKIEDYFFE